MDNLTFTTRVIGNLEWQVDLPEPMPWTHAVEYARMMDKAWGGGWRLPTVQELVSLYDYDKGECCVDWLADIRGWFWSRSDVSAVRAFCISLTNGGVFSEVKHDPATQVCLVRTIKEQNP